MEGYFFGFFLVLSCMVYDMDYMVLLYLDVFFGKREGYHSFGKVRGITIERYHCFGNREGIRLWESEGYHCFESLHGLTWLYVQDYMAWHGFVCREHGLAWLCVQRAWLFMALSGGCMAWHVFEGCWDLHLHVAQRV
jgi:hypothetical protein